MERVRAGDHSGATTEPMAVVPFAALMIPVLPAATAIRSGSTMSNLERAERTDNPEDSHDPGTPVGVAVSSRAVITGQDTV